MIKEFCDRCGKDVTYQLRQKIVTNYISPDGNMSYAMSINGTVDKDKHTENIVCNNCWEKFKIFMNI